MRKAIGLIPKLGQTNLYEHLALLSKHMNWVASSIIIRLGNGENYEGREDTLPDLVLLSGKDRPISWAVEQLTTKKDVRGSNPSPGEVNLSLLLLCQEKTRPLRWL
ncbi:hypothetical protein PoB_000145800 [Plakobranchus ocellatus]|uniref:Uncharacterized protein n=1 Tax=Plakobranchus ocellatus TaxID=259542 RepID=A0AAV3XXH4_9GAST|nr:hypothetical protein PoB_000145800 [Plakobranchus ocellatus]